MNNEQRMQLHDYVNKLFGLQDETMQAIHQSTLDNDIPLIALDPHEGRLLQFLAELISAKKILEIGTLAGYSGLWLARALPEDGRLITLEYEQKHADVARANFEMAGVGDKVEIRVGAAVDTLANMAADAPFDLIFIDADKVNYLNYLDYAIEYMRVGGLIAAHNALTSDDRPRVFKPYNEGDAEVVAYNQRIADDDRLNSFIIPAGEGFSVAVKNR